MSHSKNLEIPVVIDHYLRWVVVTPADIQAVQSAADFGSHARARREFLGMSQQGVAMILKENFGIPWHQTVVAKIESGARQVKLNEALALAQIYAMSVEDLVTGWDLEGNAHLKDKELTHHESLVAEVEAAQERGRRGVDQETS